MDQYSVKVTASGTATIAEVTREPQEFVSTGIYKAFVTWIF